MTVICHCFSHFFHPLISFFTFNQPVFVHLFIRSFILVHPFILSVLFLLLLFEQNRTKKKKKRFLFFGNEVKFNGYKKCQKRKKRSLFYIVLFFYSFPSFIHLFSFLPILLFFLFISVASNFLVILLGNIISQFKFARIYICIIIFNSKYSTWDSRQQKTRQGKAKQGKTRKSNAMQCNQVGN